MTAFFIYLIKVIICSALFAGCYWSLLRNERFFHWNRFYILASVALSIIIPMLNIPISASFIVAPMVFVYSTEITINSANVANVSIMSEISLTTWMWLGFILCLSVVFFLLTKEVISLIRIMRLKRSCERMHTRETDLYCTNDAAAPFTFFRTIFWKKGVSVDSGEGCLMLRHELAHVRLGHSCDKALMQLVCCLFWMNPFFILFRRELELVHEFAADSESLDEGNVEKLSSLILSTLYPNHYQNFISNFFQSSIKRRICMITKNKKSPMNLLRKMSIIPVALFAMYLFACNNRTQSDNDKKMSVKVQNNSDENLQVTVETVDEEIQVKIEPAEEIQTEDDKTVTKQTNNEEIPFATVDHKPLFQGGDPISTFNKWVTGEIVYPKEAFEKEIQGKVIIQFTVDRDGSVINAKVIKKVDPLLDAEALRVIKSSPKWTPGTQKGKTVKVVFQYPVNFQLQ